MKQVYEPVAFLDRNGIDWLADLLSAFEAKSLGCDLGKLFAGLFLRNETANGLLKRRGEGRLLFFGFFFLVRLSVQKRHFLADDAIGAVNEGHEERPKRQLRNRKIAAKCLEEPVDDVLKHGHVADGSGEVFLGVEGVNDGHLLAVGLVVALRLNTVRDCDVVTGKPEGVRVVVDHFVPQFANGLLVLVAQFYFYVFGRRKGLCVCGVHYESQGRKDGNLSSL